MTAGSITDEVVPAGKAPAGASKVRYLILGLCFLGPDHELSGDRANLSVALPYMDKDLHLNLSNTEKGLILGAFFWAYDGLMLVAGCGSPIRSVPAGRFHSLQCGGRFSPC